jgi:hypothetical protein
VPTPPVSAHDVAGGCCAAGFQSDLCPLWVIRDRSGRSSTTVYVRFAPKADKGTEGWLSPLCAMRRHMLAAKKFYFMTSSVRPSSGRNGYFASSARVLVAGPSPTIRRIASSSCSRFVPGALPYPQGPEDKEDTSINR